MVSGWTGNALDGHPVSDPGGEDVHVMCDTQSASGKDIYRHRGCQTLRDGAAGLQAHEENETRDECSSRVQLLNQNPNSYETGEFSSYTHEGQGPNRRGLRIAVPSPVACICYKGDVTSPIISFKVTEPTLFI